ncbi:hypothetical protein [Sporisorium scitamineum]|nr:hypothetical protein [Sporisorium scitamineum]
MVLLSSDVILCGLSFVSLPSGYESSLRLVTTQDLKDLKTITSQKFPDILLSTGAKPNYVGVTEQGRLVFLPPHFHETAYIIPSSHHPYSEHLVSDYPSNTVQSFGWHQLDHWNRGNEKLKLKKVHVDNYDIAIQLDDDRFLVSDNVPMSGFVVGLAPWKKVRDKEQTVEAEKEAEWTKDQFTQLGEAYLARGIQSHYVQPAGMRTADDT